MSQPPATRPRNFADDWSAAATASPPTTVANPLVEIQPGPHSLRPTSIGPRFHEIAIEDLVGAPHVDHRWGGIDLSPDGREIAFSWDRTGNNEVFVAPVRGDRIYQLTDGSDRSVWPRWSPDGQWIAYLRDTGGDERFQIWVMRRDGRRLRQLTSATAAGHRDIAWSPDGTRLAFVSNSTGHRYGLEIVEVASGARLVLSDFEHDDAQPRWSPDGRWLVFSSRRDAARTNADLFLIPSAGGEAICLDTRAGTEGESVDGHWSPDGRMIAFTTNVRGRSEISLAHLDGMLDEAGGPRGRSPRIVVLTNSIYDSTEPAWRPDGRGVVYLQARESQVAVRRVFVASHADSPVADLPGVHKFAHVGPDSETVAFLHASARRPHDVWVRLQRAVVPQPITSSLSARVDPGTLVQPVHVRYPSADGREIPALLYVPFAEALRGEGTPPAIVHIHGGPLGQHLAWWDPISQWFAHRGYVVLAPNIRGSTGYGREFQEANRGDWGGDDLGDVVAGVRWLGQEGIAGPKRIGAFGGSYGGFMTMYALAREPAVWAAGVSYVGVVSWKTLHETTRGDLREYLERELGDPVGAAELYRDRSPLTHARSITAPLLILQGANDPRVPQSEAEQLVAALRESKTTFDYHVYPDEGHGFRKVEHRVDMLRRATEWFDRHLRA